MSRRRRLGAISAVSASVAAAWITALAVVPAHAAAAAPRADPVIHVDGVTGTDDGACGGQGSPCKTIPYAYDKAAAGDTIAVAAGTYTLTGPLRIDKPGITFLGAMAGVNAAARTGGGAGETVITGTAAGAPGGLLEALAGDVTINGFTVEGNSLGGGLMTGETAHGYVIEDNIVTGNVVGLYAGSNGPVLVRDNFFLGDNDPGAASGNAVFTFRPLSDAVFTGNKFRGNDNAPLNIAGGEVPGGSHDITIADNDMDGEFGITLVSVSHVLITRNQMRGGWNAVQVSGGCDAITISHNDIADKTRGGILLFTGFAAVTNTNITIADNTIERTATVEGRYGIEVSRSSGVLISNDLIIDSGHGGIGFTTRGQDVPSDDVTITRDTITSSGGPGISVSDGAYHGAMTARSNRIVGNDPQRGILDDDPAAAVDARDNWWGCNSMPDGAGCDHPAGTAAGRIDFGPWLVLRIHTLPADPLAGEAASVFADLRRGSNGAVTAGPFFAPVIARFTSAPGHLSPPSVLTNADLDAQTSWPAGQPRPEQICVQVDNQVVCLHFAAHPEVSLRVTKTAVPDPVAAGQPVTFTITVANGGPADAFGVTVDDGLSGAEAGFRWTCSASAPPSRCAAPSGTGSISTTSADIAADGAVTYTQTGEFPAGTSGQVTNSVRIVPPPGTTDAGCTPGCSAAVTVSWSPVLPVTGPDLMPQAGTGACLVATGGLLLLAGRRRKRRPACRAAVRVRRLIAS
jgi:uncharacterized repeat protein (TIGR01451 family)